MKTFESFGLSEKILKALPELGINTPTPIQEQAIPALLSSDTDLIGLAQTGTGKTAAFGLPLLEKIDLDKNHTQALVLAPTRELCQQISAQLEAYSKYINGLNVLAVFGGASIVMQMKALKKPTHIIVATPGRLIDLINRKCIMLKNINLIVLDEADEMLNMGFKEDIDIILSHTPETKNTWLFSATMPSEMKSIVKKYMHKPLEVSVSTGKEGNVNISHQYALVSPSNKNAALMRFIEANEDMRCIIFCRTKADTQDLADYLIKKGYKVDALHGDLSQQARDKVMKRFKEHHLEILIATDVAARGIDVNNLTHVVHYSLPDDVEYYTHRSGRTARAGKTGISLAFVTKRDMSKLSNLKYKMKVEFTEVKIPEKEGILNFRMINWAKGVAEQTVNKGFDAELWKEVQAILADVSKEDIINRILNREMAKYRDLEDINEQSDRRERKPREGGWGSDRPERGDRGGRERERRFGAPREEGRFGRGERESGGFKRERTSERSFGERKERSFDRPERGGDRVGGERRRESSKPSKTPGHETFFINMGAIDNLNKKDLMEFISDKTGVKPSDFGVVTVTQKFSYFEVPEKASKKIASSFKGLEIDGREIRVNREG